jgi:SAM-dependent methyltransferase
MKPYQQSNKEAWEEAFSKKKGTYALDIQEKLLTETLPYLDDSFKQEIIKHSLKGKTISQFCCNNGRELLSIVKHFGCVGIGFDIADNMVEYANQIASNLNLTAKFYAEDILKISHEFDEEFDYILVTIGALCWFDDLSSFFRVVKRCLKPNGKLILNDSHPVANMIATQYEEGYNKQYPKNLVHSYFNKQPSIENDGMGYMAGSYESKEFISFTHNFEEIIQGLASNHMMIESLYESSQDISSLFPELSDQGIPLSYLILARKID